MEVKKVKLTKNIQLRKLPADAGSFGIVEIEQDEVGGHLVGIPNGDTGFANVALSPNAITLIHWLKDDVRTLWSSTKLSSDIPVENPSTIIDLTVEITDTISSKIKWNAPQGFKGNDSTKVDSYFLIISSSPIYAEGNYESSRLPIEPASPNVPESYIIPNLNSGQRYYVAIYSEKSDFGQNRRSEISNVATFFTTPLDGNVSVPKRIPLSKYRITESNLHISFNEGEYFTNYPSFRRLADQDYIIDNNGVPEGEPPIEVVARYQSYGTLQPSWYNVGFYRVIFELDGVYDLDYLYMLVQNNNRFTIYTSGDGVNLIKAFDKLDTPTNMAGWTKIPLLEVARSSVRFIVLALYVGDEWFNGFVPYGTRKNVFEIKGEKFKKIATDRTIVEAMGTNAFLAENQYDWIGKISDIARLYNNSDWILADSYKTQSNQSSNPDLIEMVSSTSHMWNYNTKMQEMLNKGNKEIVFTLVSWPVYLRPPGVTDAGNVKPVDPGLNHRDLAVTTNPQSYKHISRIIASMAYLWGSNPDAPEICNQFVDNAGQKGLNLVKYYELGNETDRSWHGDNGYFNPQEIAAMLSAMKDGHKGALGVGFGIASADPNAKLVMPGLVGINDSYVIEMLRWWDLNRGVGDYPIDVINFHHYNEYHHLTDTPTWSTVPAYGVPPEQGTLLKHTKDMLRVRGLFAQGAEVWCSEFGYDEQYGGMHSPQDRDKILRGRHKGVWILRNLLVYQALGLDAVMHFWYAGDTVNVDELNPNLVQRELFYTSGLVDGLNFASDRTRKPLQSWWFVTSFLKAMEGYKFSHVITEGGIPNIVEDNIILNYNPNVYLYAFKHETTNETVVVAWLGVDNWSTFNLELRISNDVSVVPYTDFLLQDVRQTENGVTTNIVTDIIEIGKRAIFSLSETPSIIKTSLVGTPKLKMPYNIKVQSTTSNSIKITWTDENIGTNKTRVYKSLTPASNFEIIEEEYRDSAETTITGLIPNTIYYFKLQFIDGNKISDITVEVSATTLFSLTPPDNLSKKEATSSTVTLQWTYPVELENEITGFVAYRSNTANGVYNEVGRVDKTLREFRDIGLVANTQYYFKIRSYKDSVVSNFSFNVAASTEAPSLDPPTIQSAAVHSSGSYIELIFNEELKDEQTALNAFTILENVVGGSIVAHPLRAISIGIDKTKVRLEFNITIFKTSNVTVSYSSSLGFLKSIYDVAVNSFSSFVVTNNTAEDLLPILGWTEMQSININRNNLTAITEGRGVAQVKVPSGAVAKLQFNCVEDNSMFLGLDQLPNSEGFNTMDYYIKKRNKIIEYKRVDTTSTTSVEFGVGVIRYRFTGVTIFFEVSYDNGLTFTEFANTPQPPIDLYIKVYAYPGEWLRNVVGKGLTTNSTVVVPSPPSNLVIDDDLNLFTFVPSPDIPVNQHEYSTNGHAVTPIYTTAENTTILVGDVNIPAGGILVRVKEGTDRAPSVAIASTEPFTGTISTNNKIMVQKSSGGTILYSTNLLAELLDWLSTAVITEPITVQFNTSDVYFVPNIFKPTYNNGIHWVTFQGANGVRPVFDAQRTPSSVLEVLHDYTIFKNIELRNADIENSGGCIIRGDGRKNVKFLDMTWDYGYCGIRATTGCQNLEFDNILVRNTKEGSMRLGNGVVIDQSNIIIKNIKLDDPTNGGVIENTTYPYNGGFTLKVTDGYHIENVGALSGDKLYDLGVIEGSNNTVIKNVRGTKIYAIIGDGITYINCYLPQSNYLSKLNNITILHSHMGLNISECGKILKLRGNVFLGSIGGSLNTAADIYDAENNNLFTAASSGLWVNFSFLDATPNYRVEASNLADYKLTQGQNSLFVSYANRATVNLNPFGSLRGNSAGKGMITGTIEGITDDLYGTPRTYPTDPGPFSGARPDVNDKPEPPTVIADNLARTLVFSHPLGASEILVSTNAGLYLPYAGIINVGDAPVAEGYYRAKIKSAPYRDESDLALSPSYTEKPDIGDYEVLRTIEIAFRGEFCGEVPTGNINDYWGTNAQIGSTTLSLALKDMTGTSSGITLANFEQGFTGNKCLAMPTGDYIREFVRNTWTLNGGTAKLKFTGLNDTLKYQIYLIAGTNEENNGVKFTINGVDYTKVTFGNYPITANGTLYNNPAVVRVDNLESVGGEIIISITKNGAAYEQGVINYIVIEETNINKPI